MEKKESADKKPNLPRRLFWEFRYDDIEWEEEYLTVIGRVLERGTPDEWEEMIRFYSYTKVIEVLKNELAYLPDYAIEKVCAYFPLKKEEMRCYLRKQLRRGHWI